MNMTMGMMNHIKVHHVQNHLNLANKTGYNPYNSLSSAFIYY